MPGTRGQGLVLFREGAEGGRLGGRRTDPAGEGRGCPAERLCQPEAQMRVSALGSWEHRLPKAGAAACAPRPALCLALQTPRGICAFELCVRTNHPPRRPISGRTGPGASSSCPPSARCPRATWCLWLSLNQRAQDLGRGRLRSQHGCSLPTSAKGEVSASQGWHRPHLCRETRQGSLSSTLFPHTRKVG